MLLWLGVSLGALMKAPAVSASEVASSEQAADEAAADKACARCHRAIYEKYRKTPMANASGPAVEGFRAGSFTHSASDVSYQIASEKGRVVLRFARNPQPGAAPGTELPLSGQRELRYFLGSGKRGRTYLFEDRGYWFEIPINWYAKKQVWDMAPNYLKAAQMPLTLPVDPGCLRCHASQAQASLAEARNKYAGEPFLEGGIGCVACHGEASAHVTSGGRKPMPKIEAMPAARRDSVCLSCHLEGEEAVVHQGKRLVDFSPGDNLFDYASFFISKQRASGGGRATSQWEALLRSGCKRAAGDELTCTSCHDPHGTAGAVTAAERAAYYRSRCLSCHDPESKSGVVEKPTGFAATHHPENRDCTECHMPRARSSDIAHEQVTDHSIPRLAGDRGKGTEEQGTGQGSFLVQVHAWENADAAVKEAGGGKADAEAGTERGKARDLGLAYAMEAAKGDRQAAQRALPLLKEAERISGAEADHELHAQLAFLEQLAGEKDGAEREYSLALAADAHDSFAAGNLALLKAGDRRYGEALALLERVFAEDPVQIKAGLNLAVVECGFGKREAALGTLDRILSFSPDEKQARLMAKEIRAGTHGCPLR